MGGASLLILILQRQYTYLLLWLPAVFLHGVHWCSMVLAESFKFRVSMMAVLLKKEECKCCIMDMPI